MTTTDDKSNGSANGIDGSTAKSNMHIEYRTNRSIPMFLLHHLVKPFASRIITAKTEYPPGSPQLQAPSKAKRKCNVREYRLEDIYMYELSPKSVGGHRGDDEGDASRSKRRRLYYFAGGGWQMPPSPDHWALCADLAVNLPDTIVTVVSYPLAPNSPASASFNPLLKLYKRLCQDAADHKQDVILAGDSAGGSIVLCLTLTGLTEDESLPAPATLLVISPSCDLSRSNPEIQTIAKKDPILRVPFVKSTAQKWRGHWDARDPRVSPLMADVQPLARKGVQVHGVVGRYDILSPDVILFRQKCEEAGVRGKWLDWDKQMHVFPLAYTYRLPESVQGKDWIIKTLQDT